MTDRPSNDTESGRPDWAEWFDAEFGAADRTSVGESATPPTAAPERAAVAVAVEPAPGPAPDAWVDDLFDAADADTPVAGIERPTRRAWPVRAGARIIRRPYRWCTRPWPGERIVRTVATFASLAVTTFVMMRVVHFNPLEWAHLGPDDLIFDDTTPAGGDMGAHVWAPAYLRDVLLPAWRLEGWSMDWYSGLPVYRFYMVVPALAIVALDTFLPYGVAFKVVAMSGLVTMPACCWAFGRLARFRYPVPELFAFAGLCFVLNESYSIWGGNVKSTMAGEFSFSIAVSVMMLGLGALCRALDDGRGLIWAAGLLAVACLCHGIVLIYTMVAAAAIVLCRCGVDLVRHLRRRTATSARRLRRRTFVAAVIGGFTLLFSAFWVGPFLFDHAYMTDMKYGFRPDSRIYRGDSYWDLFFDQKLALDVLINALAAAGFLLAIARRQVYGVALGITTLAAVVLTYLAHDSLPGIGLLWNPRVLPFVYLMRYLLMMVGAVEVVVLVVNAFRNRVAAAEVGVISRTVTLAAGGLAVLIAFGWVYQVLPGASFVTKGERVYAWGPFAAPAGQNRDAQGDSWTAYNFNGYERRRPYPEYYDLIQTMASLGETNGCGRALWERDQRADVGNTRYGSSMALMLLPFWTDGCIASSEGLYFEASGTTPYHFLTAAAISENAGPPVRQLRSVLNDGEVGVAHLQALGIKYLMVTMPKAIEEADAQPELRFVEASGPWRIYEVADSAIVVPLDVEPVVVNARDGDQRECWLEVGTSWFQQPDEWAALPAADGPASWLRIDVEIDETRQIPEDQGTEGCGDPQSSLGRKVNIVIPAEPIEPVTVGPATVSNVEIGEQSLEFDVDRPGVPVLVKVSYFPNWEATGAEGPFRVAPNFMVVVPTGTHVELHFGRTTSDLAFEGMTLLGIVGAFVWRFRRRPWEPPYP